MEKWYKSSLIRNLVDMHIPNGDGYLEKFDPVKYADNIKKSGADTAYIYSCNCLGLCLYPTKVGIPHKEAKRDLFGNTVKECRKRGLKVVGYTNTWATFVADAHPDWNVVYESGKTRRDTMRFGTPCVNNDAYVDYVCAHCRELVSTYKLDGFWLDMVGISAPVCHCPTCKEKYKKKTGRELPTTINKRSPEIYEYLDFKIDAVRSYLKRVYDTVKSVDPDITVAFQTASAAKHPLSYGVSSCFELSDYLSGDFYTDRPGVNVTCRMLYNATNDLPFEFMTSRCVSLERHTMNKDINELILQSYAAIMYKGSFMFIDAIDPDGEMNSEFYDDISVVSRNLDKYRPYIDYEEKPLRDVAVYYNLLSGLPREDDTVSVELIKGHYPYLDLLKIDSILASKHIDYDLISPRESDKLKTYKAVIIPSLSALSEKECDLIRDYVREGGNAYISGITSLFDDKGSDNENFMLSDLLGVDYKGRFEIKPAYLSPTKEAPELFGKHTRKYPHMLEENIVRVTPNSEGRVLATVTLPVGDVSDNITFSSAISDPPINYTEYPALFEHRYGKGRVIYSAGTVEFDKFPDSAQLLASIIGDLVGEYTVTLDAPTCVDYTAYASDSRISLNLLNSQTVYPPIRIDSVKASIKLGGKKVKSVKNVSGGRLSWSVDGDTLNIDTDLEFYTLIIAETE
ncbi:MAG: hypothetical protein E7641_03200 [Ruminococcaceae bacterium]|nr:hypothetical protein [Oscillospiraceae bacterium]